MNLYNQKRLEKIKAALTPPTSVENFVTVRVVYGAGDINHAIVKSPQSQGHDVIFLPRHGKAECFSSPGNRAKWGTAVTFAFEGLVATEAQLNQIEVCCDSGGNCDSTKLAIRFLSKMGYFSGAHTWKESESLYLNCGIAVFHFPDEDPMPQE